MRWLTCAGRVLHHHAKDKERKGVTYYPDGNIVEDDEDEEGDTDADENEED